MFRLDRSGTTTFARGASYIVDHPLPSRLLNSRR